VFTGIYAALASRVVLDQRDLDVEVSRIAARSALAREIIDFYERDIPFAVQCAYAVAGASVMLALTDWLLLPCCLTLVAGIVGLSIVLRRKSDVLNTGLNDELEREVHYISGGQAAEVRAHYRQVASWRVRLAQWGAIIFVLMELLVLAITMMILVHACRSGDSDAGRIAAMVGYSGMFITGVISVPQLVQQIGRLGDISRRMELMPQE
jgi:hypothetical protein